LSEVFKEHLVGKLVHMDGRGDDPVAFQKKSSLFGGSLADP